MKITPLFKVLFVLLITYFALTGCKKDEGPGGTSTIQGRVIAHDFDAAFKDTGNQILVYPSALEDTYIIYGTGHTTYDANFKTSYDGTYNYKYLQKGKYRIFAYSKDSTGAYLNNPKLTKTPSFIDVEITSNGSTVQAPDLIILKNNH